MGPGRTAQHVEGATWDERFRGRGDGPTIGKCQVAAGTSVNGKPPPYSKYPLTSMMKCAVPEERL